MTEPLRVIHCGTGTAGALALGSIIDDPAMQLVGLLVTDPAKVGRDAGDLAGRQATGVLATDDIGGLLQVPADCVCYMLLLPDLEQISGLLRSGKNVVTTAGLMHPHLVGAEVAQRIDDACQAGDSSLYITGVNPGWVDESLPLTMAQLSRRIDSVLIQEYADCGRYPAPHIISVMGFGKTPDQIAQEEENGGDNLAMMRSFFRQSVAALAADLGREVDEVRESREFTLAKNAYDITAGHIAVGTVAGQRWRWSGIIDGEERVVQETYWFTAFDLGPGFPREGELEDDTLWRVTLEGEPSMRCTFEPRVSFSGSKTEGDNPSALATAMAAVNALPALPGAHRGVVSPADLLTRKGPRRLS